MLKDAQEQIGEKRYYAARKTLEKAVALGSFGTETGRLTLGYIAEARK